MLFLFSQSLQILEKIIILIWKCHGECLVKTLPLKDLNEAEVFIGDIFQIGDAVVQATQPRQPCYKLGIRFGNPFVVKQFVESGFPGVYFRVLKNGDVKTGDKMELLEQKDSVSIQKVFELLFTDEPQKEAVNSAIKNPYIAESCRKDLINRWGD